MASNPTTKPTIQQRANERVCPNCGGPVVRKSTRGPTPTFCSTSCKTEHANRALVEGRAIIALLKAWRIDRGQGEIAKAAFAEAVSIIDRFNAADHAAGRPRADLYAAKVMGPGYRYIDRCKTKRPTPSTTTTAGE